MDLRLWIAGPAALFLLLTLWTFASEGFDIKECQMQETKVCSSESNGSMYLGSNKSFNLTYNEEKFIFLCKYDLQRGKWELLFVRDNPHGDETGVFLKNQTMIVMNATKAHEGIYRIVSQFSRNCLVQQNLSVLDTAPIPDVTPTSNVNISTTSPASPAGKIDTAPIPDVTPTSNVNISTTSPASPAGKIAGIIFGSIAGFIGFIGVIGIVICIKRSKKNSSPCGYTAASQAASAVEPELVMNGFGPHDPEIPTRL